MRFDFSTLRAHTDADGRVDSLGKHLSRVSGFAREFGSAFGAGELGALLGILHDVGKVIPEFQEYLQRLEAGERLASGPPHAIWGALLWYRMAQPKIWREICLPVAAHHAVLKAAGDLCLDLEEKVKENGATIEQIRQALSASGLLAGVKPPSSSLSGRKLEFHVRFLLSALCDADFLATEEHFKPGTAKSRRGWPELSSLWEGFAKSQEELMRKARREWNSVQRVRAEVYSACLDAAPLKPGLFRLTVPTGGGKTLSGLGFAIRHALLNDLRRVVLAVPYTSITEQSAKVYRDVLGIASVLEHHSSMREEQTGEQQTGDAVRARLATENWDAPAIVTTTVQLFESLFSRRPGKVRKLHNLACSVILLDEVQTLPMELLRPTLDALRSLVEDYGSTVVLCTATQPAFDDTPYLKEFADMEVREMVPGCAAHFGALKRVRYERRVNPVSWKELAEELVSQPQVMTIVNTRRDALALLDAILDSTKEKDGLAHLSALLCGAHRRKVLADVTQRLNEGNKVCAVCTQVVEAGVDIDFPAVYRAIAPLDRIVQAAGRCNRSGRPEPGRVVIFDPTEGGVPRESYRVGYDQARLLLEREPIERLHDPALYHEYFQRVFSYVDLDKKKIQERREELDYPEVAERYRFMQETVPVLVSYDGLEETMVEKWRLFPSRESWRALQPFLVNLFQHQANEFVASGWLGEAGPGLYRWFGKYDSLRGLAGAVLDPTDLVV
jgi:CRISPR-associated endonuclease/helicase Cas3